MGWILFAASGVCVAISTGNWLEAFAAAGAFLLIAAFVKGFMLFVEP